MPRSKDSAKYIPEFHPGTPDPLPPQQREQAIKAFKLIQPAPERRERCADEIAARIKLLQYSKWFKSVSPPSSPATTKQSLLDAANKLRSAASVFDKSGLRKISFFGQGRIIHEEDLNSSLDTCIAAAKMMAADYERNAAAIHVPKTSTTATWRRGCPRGPSSIGVPKSWKLRRPRCRGVRGEGRGEIL